MKIKSFYLRWAIRLSFLAGAVGLTLNGPGRLACFSSEKLGVP